MEMRRYVRHSPAWWIVGGILALLTAGCIVLGLLAQRDSAAAEAVPIGDEIYLGDYNYIVACPKAADILWEDYGICVRAGAHCAPLIHKALGTVEQGMVRFSFSHQNTEAEVLRAAEAVCELAEEG